MLKDQITESLEEAQGAVSSREYHKLAALVDPVLLTLNGESDEDETREKFPAETFVRLARVLRYWAYDLSLQAYGNDERGSKTYEKAQGVLDKALELYPGANEVRLQLEQGLLYYDRGQYDRARLTFEEIISASPPVDTNLKAAALLGMGANFRELLSSLEAENYLLQAKDILDTWESPLAPDPALAVRLLIERGWLYFYQEQYDLSLEFFADALTKASDRNDEFEARAGQLSSLQAADSQRADTQDERAKQLVEQWLAGLLPDGTIAGGSPPGLSKADVVSILLICGAQHIELNNYRASLLAHRLAVEIDPNSRKAWLFKIDALKWSRRYEEAEAVYQLAQKSFRPMSRSGKRWPTFAISRNSIKLPLTVTVEQN